MSTKVSESVFWARYLFRIGAAQEEEAARQVIRREAQARALADGRVESHWDDDDQPVTGAGVAAAAADGDIPDDVAAKLLSDYEKEVEGRVAAAAAAAGLRCKEKDDMVLVSRAGESGRTSPGKGKTT